MIAFPLFFASIARSAKALLLWAPLAQPVAPQPSGPPKPTAAPQETAPATPPKKDETPNEVASSTPAQPLSPSVPAAFAPTAVAPDRAEILVTTLPCGLRVMIAQDTSLPVAATVLSLPSGQADDPARNPGLIHALAYALQMGNRELSPGAALDEVYDSGGFAEMAVGAGQTRFESLVPQWSLGGVLRVEADRLAMPAISEPLWMKALQFAAQDRRPPNAPHAPLRAVAYDQPSLLHDGRVVHPALAQVPLPALARYLAQHFSYHLATLAVVSPLAPHKTLKTVRETFAKRPAAPRAPAKLPPQISVSPRPGQSTNPQSWMLRAFAGDPHTQKLAQILCEQLKRRGPAKADASRAPSLACAYYPSATHPFMQVPLEPNDPSGSVLAARLADIAAGLEDAALPALANRVLNDLRAQGSGPLALARHLASLPEWPLPAKVQGYTQSSLRGHLNPQQVKDGASLRAMLLQSGLLTPSTYRVAKAAPKAK